jgi:hypothetical protein
LKLPLRPPLRVQQLHACKLALAESQQWGEILFLTNGSLLHFYKSAAAGLLTLSDWLLEAL